MLQSSTRDIIKNSKPAVVLMLICLVSGALLAITCSQTKGKIAEAEQRATNQALSKVFPTAENFVLEDDYYKILENGELIGYAAITEGRGYGWEPIKMVVGSRLDGTVEGVHIISHSETPGLGSMVAEDEFLGQFEGTSLGDLELSEDGGEIDAVTGATISSRAVVDTVREEVQRLIEVLTEAQG